MIQVETKVVKEFVIATPTKGSALEATKTFGVNTAAKLDPSSKLARRVFLTLLISGGA